MRVKSVLYVFVLCPPFSHRIQCRWWLLWERAWGVFCAPAPWSGRTSASLNPAYHHTMGHHVFDSILRNTPLVVAIIVVTLTYEYCEQDGTAGFGGGCNPLLDYASHEHILSTSLKYMLFICVYRIESRWVKVVILSFHQSNSNAQGKKVLSTLTITETLPNATY